MIEIAEIGHPAQNIFGCCGLLSLSEMMLLCGINTAHLLLTTCKQKRPVYAADIKITIRV